MNTLKDIKKTFNNLYKKIMPIMLEAKNRRKERRDRGEYFNIFRVMRMQNDEVYTHSAIIAALLNPKESHGCRDIFLRIFLSQNDNLKKFEDEIIDANVFVEHYIGEITSDKEEGGRLDIFIKLKTKDKTIFVIIENKIYANDKEKQLVRYYNFGKKELDLGHCSEYYIFYLNLFGTQPSGFSTDNGRIKCGENFHCISYRDDIINWLNVCLEKSVQFPLVREIIVQYRNLVLSLTNQNMDKDLKNAFVKEITSNCENMLIASSINANYKQILNQMCKNKLENVFTEIAKELKLEHKFYGNGSWCDKYHGVVFSKPNWTKVRIGFEFMKDMLDNFSYGIKYTESERQNPSKELENMIQKDLGTQSSGPWWPWYKSFKYSNFTYENSILALYNGDEIEKLFKAVINDLIPKVDSYNDNDL